MINRLRIFVTRIAGAFWFVPTLMVLGAILGAVGLVWLDSRGLVPDLLIQSAWLYNGGGMGARTLLGTVAASAIGVAGTVFSITIAALSLAAGQMGPRLLRNFTRDRGNQFTLGAFLGTFSYAVMVLRSVRLQGEGEGEFVPHLALSAGILLAFLCVGTLVYFVNRLGGALCDMVPLHLPNGLYFRDKRCVLVVPAVDHDGLVDGMFHLIRQNVSSSPRCARAHAGSIHRSGDV